jgi:flagellar protein FlgJ
MGIASKGENMSDMDFTSINSAYSQFITDSAKQAQNAMTKAALKTDMSKATDDELMTACKKFEAYFLEQCFKEMTKTVGKEEFTSQSTSTLVDYFKDEMVKTMAEKSTEQNSLGLAQMLYEQMKRNYNL